MSVGKLRSVGICLALGSGLALGCGSEEAQKPAAQPGSQTAVVDPGSGDTAALPDFDVMPTIELPAAFPKDVPLYANARVVKATPDQWNPVNWVAQFSTEDEPSKVSAGLVDSLAAEGWAAESTTVADGIMVYANKEQRLATYALSPSRGKTLMTLIIVENENP